MKIPVTTSTWFKSVIAGIQPPLTPRRETLVVDECARYVTVKPETEAPQIEIRHLTDLQFGHKKFKAVRFAEFRDWILSRPNCYVLLGGDVIDAGTMLSVGSAFDQAGNPHQQVMKIVELLTPLAPRI